MKLAFLPPYSPELNPQEQIWDGPREKSLANRVFRGTDAVVDAAVEGLRRVEASPGGAADEEGLDGISTGRYWELRQY
jgi:hypothetical protein